MKHKLFEEFEHASPKLWKQKIQYDLKGADYNEKLVWESSDGIKVKPFYSLEDLESLELPEITRTTPWKIAQEIQVADVSAANQQAIKALKKGAESLIFVISEEYPDWSSLFKNIDLANTPIYFHFQYLSAEQTEPLIAFLQERRATAYLNLDVLGHFAKTGNWYSTKKGDFKTLKEILDTTKNRSNIKGIAIDVSLYQNAGANQVQQLAYALAHAHEYLNEYGSDLVKTPLFKVAVGGNYFFEIAKIRALRLLWKVLAADYGVSHPCHILASPSKRNKTVYAYNTNMIRTTSECMSAVIGGADGVANLRYDFLYNETNEFAQRMARNQLLLLKNEARFDHLDDPAKGSYYIEVLTEQLAERALQLFKNIEASGGFLNQLQKGTLQRKIKESALKEQRLFDLQKEILVGSNAFGTAADVMKDSLEINPFAPKRRQKTSIEPIIERRLAELFERQKLKAEGWKPSK